MPKRPYITDKPRLQNFGFRFISGNGTLEFVGDESGSGFHVSIHPNEIPAVWDRFHLKVYDLRNSSEADFTRGYFDPGAYVCYQQVSNDGPILLERRQFMTPAEIRDFSKFFDDAMDTVERRDRR
jgi:hypothetical protein